MSADQEAKRNCIFWLIMAPVLTVLCLVQVAIRPRTDTVMRIVDLAQAAAWATSTVFHARWFSLIRKRERLARL